MQSPSSSRGGCVLAPEDAPTTIILARKTGVTLLDKSALTAVMAAPLPGIVVFVHGVNSDGEWYTAAEEGLCKGLNARLKRCDEQMAYPTAEGGQLTPPRYLAELSDDGFINAKWSANSFIQGDDHFTPVIRFRWGYKASPAELQEYGDSIYLNEHNYWGGGPFANGCSALPDLWSAGLSDSLFLWLNVEHLNPDPGRHVFACPHRAYFVLAALRLAKLVEAIRKMQADVPITIVCHSQGNMIGMAAAFLGDEMDKARDGAGVEGRCVADNYVLCNPPFSLAKSNLAEDWGDSHMTARDGSRGRQTAAARSATLRTFFDIIRQPASVHQDAEKIDKYMANKAHGFDIATDRARYGYGPGQSTCCRVTLYCNPHDKVISATPIQGIGWRGLSAQEIKATGGAGVFTQRVFAQDFKVGVKGSYDYWADHWRQLADDRGSQSFWRPQSLKARYSLSRGMASSTSFFGKVLTFLSAPVMIGATTLTGVRINALPDDKWRIPIEAPELDAPFKPQAVRLGTSSDAFDEGYDAPGQHRDQQRERTGDAPYSGDREIPKAIREHAGPANDAALGNLESEAALRYEDHARLRMFAKREGLVKKDQQVTGEDNPDQASAEYKAWRNKKIKSHLNDNIAAHATDHSTILTNPMHSEKALAYDIAIGMCHIKPKDLHELRTAADWRLLKGLGDDVAMKSFLEYFMTGKYKMVSLEQWSSKPDGEGCMPTKIVDQREQAAAMSPHSGEHP